MGFLDVENDGNANNLSEKEQMLLTVRTRGTALMKEGIQLLAKIQKNEEEKTAKKQQKKAQIDQYYIRISGF